MSLAQDGRDLHFGDAREGETPEALIQRDREFATIAALAARPDQSLADGLKAIKRACSANLRILNGKGQ